MCCCDDVIVVCCDVVVSHCHWLIHHFIGGYLRTVCSKIFYFLRSVRGTLSGFLFFENEKWLWSPQLRLPKFFQNPNFFKSPKSYITQKRESMKTFPFYPLYLKFYAHVYKPQKRESISMPLMFPADNPNSLISHSLLINIIPKKF